MPLSDESMIQTVSTGEAQRRKKATETREGSMKKVASDQILERWVVYKD